MKKKYDAVATVGKYTDREGNEKKRYVTIGAIFEDDQGRMSMKLDAVPCSPDWSGWVSFYEPDRNRQGQSERPPAQNTHNTAKANAYQPRDNSGADADANDDIPFAPYHSWRP
jgi:hypothetical protein